MKASDYIFMIGAPRSGSTWLQLMLGSHPEIATGQESQVFNEYIAILYGRWQQEMSFSRSEAVRQHGIATYITEEEFLCLLRNFVCSIFEKSVSLKPGARYFLEKSPSSSPHAELINRCFPSARFIHILRDGRDVATSLLMASKGWGRSWAPSHIDKAAAAWRDDVLEARKAEKFGERYIELRYEDLKDNGEAELQRLFEFLRLDCEPREINRIYRNFGFEKMANHRHAEGVFMNQGAILASGTSSRREPPGFFRKGEVGSWRGCLTSSELDIFYWVAGKLLVDLGYATEREVKKTSVKPLSLVFRDSREVCIERIKAIVRESGSSLLQQNSR